MSPNLLVRARNQSWAADPGREVVAPIEVTH